MSSYSLGTRRRNWSKIWLTLGIVTFVILVVLSVFIRAAYQRNLGPVNGSQRTITVTIEAGSSVDEIAETLEEKGVIRSAWAFSWFVRNNDARDRLQAGTYNLRSSQGVPEIVNILTQGKIATDLITILPGQRLDQIRSSLINNGGFSAEAVDAALQPDQYLDMPALADKPRGANLEGYLYPESFQKTAATTPEEIIRASLNEMQKHLNPDLRNAITKQGLTVHEGVILASIIEQEVAKKEDKSVVAQIFLKRLREGMKLESDVTAIYGSIKAGQKPSLTFDSLYNSYIHKGLPPSPISNVSAASLEAIANPAKSDYLYFVSGDDGVTYFSRTLEEHENYTRLHCTEACNN